MILSSLINTRNILDNINQAIFSVDQEEHIIDPISMKAAAIFGSSLTPGHHFRDFLSQHFILAQEDSENLSNNIIKSFQESKIFWNEIKNLPSKLELKENENNFKTLKLKYAPIWNNEILDRIVFYFFDVTNYEEEKDKSTKYSLSQIASLAEINIETLRSWTKRFNIKGQFNDSEKK